ncbi:glycosyltransferase family 4 protein [uncultured Zobellia sp.]|uniref:glycosyltransferase family 4 protein n=1 Tax=uncultured Zobellia sp. TaxID=255433 RepID=UPI002594751B|nr:glycosyltransferase family 4 protein [uncultured Zobellia sp.]
MNTNKNILILCSASFSLSNFRGDLIKHLLTKGFKVYCGGPDFDENTLKMVRELGGIPVPFNLQRTGLNPLSDYNTIKELKTIMVTHKIDVLFPYTIKPVIYGSFAAKKLGIPVISLITGLGFTFSRVTTKAKVLQSVTEFLYRKALKSNKAVIFQNSDDLELFKNHKIVARNQSLHVVNGSGINLDKFSFKPRRHSSSSAVKFVLVARLMKEKGVELLMNGARELKPHYPNSEFHIIGEPPENSSSAVSKKELEELDRNGTIVYHGKSTNVAKSISELDIFVLPTYYREGVPRSILEALSSGMPIITTMQPGCKETVVEGKNGFLIAPKEEKPLVDAMKYFLDNPGQIEIMGQESRKLAENKFDVNLINSHIFNIIEKQL